MQVTKIRYYRVHQLLILFPGVTFMFALQVESILNLQKLHSYPWYLVTLTTTHINNDLLQGWYQ